MQVNNPDSSTESQDRRKSRRIHPYHLFRIGSIFQWILVIFFVVTLPLILALLYSNQSIQDYTDQSNKTLFQTLEISKNAQSLFDELLIMYRSIRQYQVLEDKDIFTVFQAHHQRFVNISNQTNNYYLSDEFRNSLDKLMKSEAKLYAKILFKKDLLLEKISLDDIKGYMELRTVAKLLVDKGNQQTQKETALLSKLAVRLNKQVTYATLVSVILAFVLGLLLLSLINRPIKHIERAIRKLGNAELDDRIYIEGPRDLREIGTHLDWLRQKLNQLENSRQFFIKTISHELKTPLATLMEGADLLQEQVVGEINAEQLKIIRLLQIANIRLNSLVENLLEYQKVTYTEAKMNYSQVDLNQIIVQICEDNQLLLDSKGLTVAFNEEPVIISVDREKIRIIVSNLFSNALKFSPNGGQINIQLQIENNELYMLIADQGEGVSKGQLEHLFTEFYKQTTPENWKIRGSGLGLSLVKDYVLAHHGKIKLLAPDTGYSGARFLVIIPTESNIISL
jgi:two-component system sensor histidine kinase GlrK